LLRSLSHYPDFMDLGGDGWIVLYKSAGLEPKWTVRLKSRPAKAR